MVFTPFANQTDPVAFEPRRRALRAQAPMIKLSRLADYAVVLLSQMGGETKAVHNALDLAERTGLPMPTVSKVLAMLARDGILISVRGAKGGYRLAAPPARISVANVIAAIDGPIALTQCVDSAGSCNVETLCPTRAGWHKINAAILGALTGVTLADLIAPPLAFTEPPAPPRRASQDSA
jgi:FeS assembly SUF system regulator